MRGTSYEGEKPEGGDHARGNPSEHRIALVIGNGAYGNTAPLTNPVSDASAMAAALKRLNFEVLHAQDLDYAAFAGRVRDFGRALREAHVVLFYYVGRCLRGGKITPGEWERRRGRLSLVYRRRGPSLLVADRARINRRGQAVVSR